MKTTSNKGFTLIEMLVVCLIIVLLAGMVFRLVGLVGRNNSRNTTRGKLEKTAAALEEFKSIYGKYPPVELYPTELGMRPLMYYEFPCADTYGTTKSERWSNIAPYLAAGSTMGRRRNWTEKNGDGIFTFGLCSFFIPRVTGTAVGNPKDPEMPGGALFLKPDSDSCLPPEQWTHFNNGNENGDTKRDLDAVRRILPFLGESMNERNEVVGLMARKNPGILEAPWDRWKRMGDTKTNEIVTIRDAWGHDLFYWSLPPYETYKLWSAGEDGMTTGSKCRIAGHGHKGEHGTDWAGEFWRVAEGELETKDDIVVGIY